MTAGGRQPEGPGGEKRGKQRGIPTVGGKRQDVKKENWLQIKKIRRKIYVSGGLALKKISVTF